MRKGDFDVYVKEIGGAGAEHAVLDGPDDTDPFRPVVQVSNTSAHPPAFATTPQRPVGL